MAEHLIQPIFLPSKSKKLLVEKWEGASSSLATPTKGCNTCLQELRPFMACRNPAAGRPSTARQAPPYDRPGKAVDSLGKLSRRGCRHRGFDPLLVPAPASSFTSSAETSRFEFTTNTSRGGEDLGYQGGTPQGDQGRG